MPTKVGIHGFAARAKGKSWMPTFVGMTGGWRLQSYHCDAWYNARSTKRWH